MATLSEIQAQWSQDPTKAPTQASGQQYLGQHWERAASGNWYPAGHSELTKQGLWTSTTPTGGTPTGGTPTGGTPTDGTPSSQTGNIQQQAQNASTYAATAGAQPQKYTANAGTQDVVRNSYLQQATQGTNIDRNDPNFRQQADAFSAGVERQKQNYLADQAEAMGPYASGALRGQARMASEQAGRAIGGFEAELVGRELQNRRDEIQRALTAMTGILGSDQQAQLQRELAALEAEIRKMGFAAEKDIAGGNRDLQRDLGFAGLDLDWAKLRAQQDQFADELGFRIRQHDDGFSNPYGGW